LLLQYRSEGGASVLGQMNHKSVGTMTHRLFNLTKSTTLHDSAQRLGEWALDDSRPLESFLPIGAGVQPCVSGL